MEGGRRKVPKYILGLWEENLKHGRNVNNLYCIFPKIIRTKRAIKLVFKNNSLKNDENTRWKRDELLIFMNTAKKSIVSSQKRYYLKIFDLFSRRTVNTYKFSSKDHGWKIINISAWRNIKPRLDNKGRFGMKIVVTMGKRKLNINKTAFRKGRSKNDPYFVEFFHPEETKIKVPTTSGKGLFEIGRFHKSNSLPASKFTAKKPDYYIPFQRYDMRRALE